MLTRAKSLVVAVGNPSKLLSIERHMVVEYGKKARCWSSFLNQCLLNDTFIVPDSVASTPQAKECLKKELHVEVKTQLGLRVTAVPAQCISPVKPTLDQDERSLLVDQTTNTKPSRTSPRQKKKQPNSEVAMKVSVDKERADVRIGAPIKQPLLSNPNVSKLGLPRLETVSKPLLDTPSILHTTPANSKPVMKHSGPPMKSKAQLSPNIATSKMPYSAQQPTTETPLPTPKSSSPQSAMAKKEVRREKQQLQQQETTISATKTRGQDITSQTQLPSKKSKHPTVSQTKTPNGK